jgi:hypothetical protein
VKKQVVCTLAAASDEGNNPYVDLAKVDYNFGSKNWELSVGRNDVYRIGRDAYGLQYFDALDGAELRYHNDNLAITTGYGKFKDGKKPGVDTVKPISDAAHSDHFSTDGLKTGYGEIDAFFGGGKAARSEAGFYYNRLHQSNHSSGEDYFAKYIAGYFMGGNPFTWRFSSDMDNQRSWGIGADYIVAKNLKFSVMQSFASQAKTGSPDPHEMTRIHFQMLF